MHREFARFHGHHHAFLIHHWGSHGGVGTAIGTGIAAVLLVLGFLALLFVAAAVFVVRRLLLAGRRSI